MDLDNIVFQLKRGLNLPYDAEVFFISLKIETETEIEPSHQEVIARVLSQLMFEQFHCVPIQTLATITTMFLQALPLVFVTLVHSSLKG